MNNDKSDLNNNIKRLRPKKLEDFIGQESIKKSLAVFIASSKGRGDPLDHTLFYGPPGLGKTTLAKIISEELNVTLKQTTGPSLEKVADLASILIGLSKGDILFIDEIHRLPKMIEEVLYSAMEDFKLPIVAGSKKSAHTIVLDLNPFTVIGATTRFGLLSPPLRDRFGIVYHLEPYTPDELKQIVERDSEVFNIKITDDAAKLIGKRARGVPRIAIQLLKRVRDYSSIKEKTLIDLEDVNEAFSSLHIDEFGLNDLDRKYLLSLIEKFKGGPVGIDAISNSIGEDKGTIEEIIEPYLLKINFIVRTPKGRIATNKAKKYFNIPYNEKESLF
ncbi:MAG: Holliday junction branch migration DNA helicase RuvB [Caldisericaceae bacterium]